MNLKQLAVKAALDYAPLQPQQPLSMGQPQPKMLPDPTAGMSISTLANKLGPMQNNTKPVIRPAIMRKVTP